MNYQELSDILRRRSAGFSNMQPPLLQTPTLDQIISGIQSQYQAPQFQASQFQQISPLSGASRFTGGPQSFSQENITPVSQSLAPKFIPGAFDLAAFTAKPTVDDVINAIENETIGSSNGADSGSPSGISVDDAGLATSSNISPGMVGALATGLGFVTGLPTGLMATIAGKGNIANAINAAGYNSAVAHNNALVAAQMGLDPSDPSNAAALASAIDSLSSSPTGTTAATPGAAGTGGSAAAAATSAAAAASAAGHSDAAIGAASQAAANAAIGGASQAAQSQAASDAAASVDGGTTGLGSATGVGVGSTTGINSMDAASDAAASGGGGGAGGAKIICTKLHELGMMPANIYEADQAFGKKLVNESSETYDGYVRWAKHIVDLMSRNDLLGKTAVFCAYHIATPWSLAMAEEMGQPVKASWFGRFLMKRGLQLCKFIGSGNKQTVIA